MKQLTRSLLNKLNHRFYEANADLFDQTRQQPWPGWEKVWSQIKDRVPESPRILDIGAGNGRFGQFFQVKVKGNFRYTAVDQSRKLAAKCKRRVKAKKVHVIHQDALDAMQALRDDMKTFDLVVLFGLLHHLPSQHLRKKVLRLSARLLKPEGIMAASYWQFRLDKTASKKVVPWEKLDSKVLDQSDLEPDDYLLTFAGQKEPRYCHHFTDEEIKGYLKIPGLEVAGQFKADGKSGRLNHYVIYNLAADKQIDNQTGTDEG